MSWSFRIGEAFGIPLRVHATFLLLVAWSALGWATPYGASGAMFGALVTLLLFVGVALHELGHSVVAQRAGVSVREIVLFPFGGVANLAGMPRRPQDEIRIALAGPAVNLVIALVLGVTAGALAVAGRLDLEAVKTLTPSWTTLLGLLLAGNLSLALFNLLPIFPLDGGRVLRAALALRWGHERATRWAARVGQVGAFGLGALALFTGHLMLGLIAVLIFFAAGRESFAVSTESQLARLTAGQVYESPQLILGPDERVLAALARSLRTSQNAFPVVLGTSLLGFVTRDELLHAARTRGDDPFVVALARRSTPIVDVESPLDHVLRALEHSGSAVVLVTDQDVPVGMITREHVLGGALVAAHAIGVDRPRVGRPQAEL